jgi:VCBS repeat-containing protein
LATEDGSTSTLDALANASDADHDVLTVVNVPTLLPDGVCYDTDTHSFTLDPSVAAYQHLAQGEQITVAVNYGVSDGDAVTQASVSWTVTGTNDAPVAVPVTLTHGTEDASYIIQASDLLPGVSDIDSQSLSITGISIASGGGDLVDNHNGSWTYTPASGYAGPVSFTYVASDGALHASSTANLTLDQAVTPVTVTVNVHTPTGYDFSTFYDDFAASQPVTGDGSSEHAFVLDAGKGFLFEMVSSNLSVDPQTGSISYVIDEIDIFGTTDPAQATAAHLLVSTHGWNMNVQAVVNTTAPSDPVQSTGPSFDDIFGAVAFNYVGNVGPDVFLASNHPDVFNGSLGPTDPGSDTVDYSRASGPISVNLLTGATAGTAAAGDTFSSIENLRGTAFDDMLTGDGHDNVLFGGAGNDTFVFKQNAGGIGRDTIGDFAPGQDKIELDYTAFDASGPNDFSHWLESHATSVNNGNDVQIDLDGNGHNTILLQNVTLAHLHANDFILPPGSV